MNTSLPSLLYTCVHCLEDLPSDSGCAISPWGDDLSNGITSIKDCSYLSPAPPLHYLTVTSQAMFLGLCGQQICLKTATSGKIWFKPLRVTDAILHYECKDVSCCSIGMCASDSIEYLHTSTSQRRVTPSPQVYCPKFLVARRKLLLD